jgi:hypothetical protein
VSVTEQIIDLVVTQVDLPGRRRMMGTRGPIPLLKINVVTVVSVNQILRDGPMPILDHDVDQCVNQSSSV